VCFSTGGRALFLLSLKLWGIETIRKILNNEKYYGDVLLQKTYIADFFTGKQVPNRGKCESYLLEDHHEAIIPRKID